MLQDDLQPHGHHAGHPVDQAGADVGGHPPLERRGESSNTDDRPGHIRVRLT